MSIFLFLKQIVDMLYQWKILDYGMVLFAVGLIIYKIWKERNELSKIIKIQYIDVCVIGLCFIYLISWLRYPSAYGTFFKVESCFLVYFLGRICVTEIVDCGKVLAYAGYGVVYANFLVRFYQFGWKLTLDASETTLLNEGGLYYYKTDLAFGILIATLFIYVYGKNNLFKWFTIIVTSSYMVFYSGARMGQVVMCLLYGLIIVREWATRRSKHLVFSEKIESIVMNILLVGMIGVFVVIQVFPYEKLEGLFSLETEIGWKIENVMHARHVIWTDILEFFSEQNLLTRLLGIDLGTEYMRTSYEMRAHSQYIKQIYSTGYVGCILILLLVKKVFGLCCNKFEDKLKFITCIVWIALLGFGFSIESLEATQMSWFPMLFLGVLCSLEQGKQEVSIASER